MASSDHTAGFDPADRLAQDRESVRRRFWIKFKQVVAQLPFAEDLLAAYYCAFDKETPRHVQAALLGAVAYFILPFDFIPDMLPLLGFTDDAAVLATAIRLVAGHITQEHRDAARAALKRGIDNADVPQLSFEKALAELESIVQKLERGDVALEESVTIYERGEALKRRCEELLRQAEARVEKITLDSSGKPTGTEPLDVG